MTITDCRREIVEPSKTVTGCQAGFLAGVQPAFFRREGSLPQFRFRAERYVQVAAVLFTLGYAARLPADTTSNTATVAVSAGPGAGALEFISVAVTGNPAVNFPSVPGSTGHISGVGQPTVVTSWSLGNNRQHVTVYAYFASMYVALQSSQMHDIIPTAFFLGANQFQPGVLNGTGVTVGQTDVSSGAGNLTGSRTDTLALALESSAVPAYDETYSGTLNIYAVATP